MKFSQSNTDLLSFTNTKVWKWFKEFGKFSLFYGNYLASLHAHAKSPK